jgi:hypothetical protein
MTRRIVCIGSLGVAIVVLSALLSPAQQTLTRYDYHESNEELINGGMQALFICNGLFVSNRTMDQLYGAELKMDQMPLASPDEIKVDRERKTVEVAQSGRGPTMRAAYREGIGCVVMGPEQTFADVDQLPSFRMPALPGDPSRLPWPEGDLIEAKALPKDIDAKSLNAGGRFCL